MPDIYTMPFEPDWGSQVKYRITFPNQLSTSYDGTDQITLLRQIPILEAEMKYAIADDFGSTLFDSLIWQGQSTGLMVPIWLYSSLMNIDLHIGDTQIAIPTGNPYFYPDTHIAIINVDNNTIYELCTISSNDGKVMNLLLPLTEEWTANTYYIVGCRPARLPAEAQVIKHTSNMTEATFVFKYQDAPFIVPQSRTYTVGDVLTDDYNGVTLYKNEELCAVEGNRLNETNITFNKDYTEMDYTTGIITVVDKTDHAKATLTRELVLSSSEEIINFAKWLYRRKGRNRACWIPSGQRDIIAYRDIKAGDTSILVEDGVLEKLYPKSGTGNAEKIHQLRSNIIIFKYDMTYSVAEIQSVDTSSRSNGFVELSVSAIDKSYPLGDIAAICFLHHVRLDSDTVEIDFTDKLLANVSLQFRESLYE